MYDGYWTTWTPNSGNLVISFVDGQNVMAVWMPAVPVAVTFTFSPVPATGASSYVANAGGAETGAECVPIPPGVTTVTLSATYASPLSVYGTSIPFNPFKGENL